MTFQFANPFSFLFGITLLLLLVWRWRRGKTPGAPVLRYADTRIFMNLPMSIRVRLRRTPDILQMLAWLCLLVAAARPQVAIDVQNLSGSGIDMVIALDISSSMANSDFEPNRLAVAKNVIADFVRSRPYDRIGLVVFAEDAIYQAPPTLDHDIFLRILGRVSFAPDLNLANRTAVGLGITSSLNMLKMSDAPTRVVILVTDGASNTGAVDPLSAAQIARVLGIRIYVIGIGTTESTRTLEEDRLDETLLRDVAMQSRGQYLNASNPEQLQEIYEQINRLEANPAERNLRFSWRDLAFYWLSAAAMLLLIERLLRQTIFQKIP